MLSIPVRIGALGDPVLFPEHAEAKDASVLGFCILEGGMVSGKAAVALIVEVDGKKGCVQMSAAMFHSLNSAVLGAEQRFAGNKKRN